jgi:hypothetical protein
VNESFIGEDVTEGIFNREEGKLVDEVNLTITYKAVDLSFGSLQNSETRNAHATQEINVPSTEAKTKVIVVT